ncbi:MAG: dienelactone hydrolase family protein [Chitinophagales bacterium]
MEFRYHSEVEVLLSKASLKGELNIPPKATSIIIFSHGSGSSRLSPRNKIVADYFHKNNFATLLFDLLTKEEDDHFYNRFNTELLTHRLIDTTKWIENFEPSRHLSIGYFGASTGAASALKAGASLPNIQAIVSRGGRPDLVMESLRGVKAPTLLIVGSLDPEVLDLNKKAYAQLICEKKLR